MALSAAGLIVFAVQEERIQEQVVQEVEQELAEFDALQSRGIDPETSERFADVPSLIGTFLRRNVPDEAEQFIGWWNDGPRLLSPGARLTGDPAFDEFVSTRVGSGGSHRVDSVDHGELLVTIQPVRSNSTKGALVLVTFLDQTRQTLFETMRTYAVVALLLLSAVTALAAWQSGRLLAPLRTLRETAGDITTTDLSRRIPESGNDDITALTRTLNDMLDRLEGGFEGQRRFLDDAGHELRTPLTVLRGNLELLDTGSPEDVAYTRAILVDEVDRMSRLVGDLIVLAKTRRPDFLTPSSVDLAVLTRTLRDKARALGDRDWRLDGVGRGLVHLDEQRITQAVLQLADNAVKHTASGDRIALGSDLSDGTARLWVRDSGTGIVAEDREHIFERFARSDVRPGDEGFGLGLSIVRAIALASGGSITVEDEIPHGAKFEIVLPSQETPWPTS